MRFTGGFICSVLIASSSAAYAAKTSSVACEMALDLGLILTTERKDSVIEAMLHDAGLALVGRVEARVDGAAEPVLFVTATEGADDDPPRLAALLAGAMELAPEARAVDIYLTDADFHAAIVPALNRDLPPSRGVRQTARYEVLRSLGFEGEGVLRFERVGEDGEHEVQVRLIMTKARSSSAIDAAGSTRLQ